MERWEVWLVEFFGGVVSGEVGGAVSGEVCLGGEALAIYSCVSIGCCCKH